MKDKILNVLTYSLALLVIGSIAIKLFADIKIKGLTQIVLSLFLISYSFEKSFKYNKFIIRIVAILILMWGCLLIFMKF